MEGFALHYKRHGTSIIRYKIWSVLRVKKLPPLPRWARLNPCNPVRWSHS